MVHHSTHSRDHTRTLFACCWSPFAHRDGNRTHPCFRPTSPSHSECSQEMDNKLQNESAELPTSTVVNVTLKIEKSKLILAK